LFKIYVFSERGKAESLEINSVGQRPTIEDQINSSPERAGYTDYALAGLEFMRVPVSSGVARC